MLLRLYREEQKSSRVGVSREHDQPGHTPEQDRYSHPGLRVPALSEIEKRSKQEERVWVAVRAVERRVVIEVRAKEQRGKRCGGDAVAEMSPERSTQDRHPGHHPEQPG